MDIYIFWQGLPRTTMEVVAAIRRSKERALSVVFSPRVAGVGRTMRPDWLADQW
jgi:hypothetical protein